MVCHTRPIPLYVDYITKLIILTLPVPYLSIAHKCQVTSLKQFYYTIVAMME